MKEKIFVAEKRPDLLWNCEKESFFSFLHFYPKTFHKTICSMLEMRDLLSEKGIHIHLLFLSAVLDQPKKREEGFEIPGKVGLNIISKEYMWQN